MNIFFDILFTRLTIDLIFGILFLWIVSHYIINRGQLLLFAPFAGMGIVAAFTAGFSFYGFFADIAWLSVELTSLLLITFLFIVLVYYDRDA